MTRNPGSLYRFPIALLERSPEMRQEQLIAKLIDLEDRANAHTSQYLKLLSVPQKRTSASIHYQKALKLRARVQELIRKIALCDSARS
jgi:hypothetical protein